MNTRDAHCALAVCLMAILSISNTESVSSFSQYESTQALPISSIATSTRKALSRCVVQEGDGALICANFDTFDQLEWTDFNQTLASRVELRPKRALRLDDSLSLSGLRTPTHNWTAVLTQLAGFDILVNPFMAYNDDKSASGGGRSSEGLTLLLDNLTMFEFFYHNQSISTNVCSSIMREELFVPLFAAVRFLTIGWSAQFSAQPLCPVVFQNARISSLTLQHFNGSLQRSAFTFISVGSLNLSSRYDLNASIETLNVDSSQFALDTKAFLDRDVFKQLRVLRIERSRLAPIQATDLFSPFIQLSQLFLGLTNYNEFIRQSNNSWMRHLNGQVHVDLLTISNVNQTNETPFWLYMNDESNSESHYTYPDADFCLFSDFPHSQLVMPVIGASSPLACTCTLLWLLHFEPIYRGYMNQTSPVITEATRSCLTQPDAGQLASACNFEHRRAVCANANSAVDSEPSYIGVMIGSGVASFLLGSLVVGLCIYFFKVRKIKQVKQRMSFRVLNEEELE